MRKKHLIVIFLVVYFCIVSINCTNTAGPDRTPKWKIVQVKYVRVLPIPSPSAPGGVSIRWAYTGGGGETALSYMRENTFFDSIGIYTETRITLSAADKQKWNGYTYWVAKQFNVDDHELVRSETYGEVAFRYNNDGTVYAVK